MVTQNNGTKKLLFLFDVDGTLTPAQQQIKQNMIDFLSKLRETHDLAIVGGSDYTKIYKQLSDNINLFKVVCTENGLVSYDRDENNKLKIFHTKKISDYLGEDRLKKMINFFLKYISEVDIPKKRGHFIDYRSGMLNVSPIGRCCTLEERLEFNELNKTEKILEKFQEVSRNEFKDYGLVFSIGGQISFDVFPKGWDKSYSVQFFEGKYDEIHFFGDKTYDGGNDYEIFIDKRVIGHSVVDPEDTIKQIEEILKKI